MQTRALKAKALGYHTELAPNLQTLMFSWVQNCSQQTLMFSQEHFLAYHPSEGISSSPLTLQFISASRKCISPQQHTPNNIILYTLRYRKSSCPFYLGNRPLTTLLPRDIIAPMRSHPALVLSSESPAFCVCPALRINSSPQLKMILPRV